MNETDRSLILRPRCLGWPPLSLPRCPIRCGPGPASAPTTRRPINPWVVALTVTLATFMELLDTSIANVSLPYIAGGLGRSYDEVTWILTTYLVANAVVLPMSAWLSRVLGRRITTWLAWRCSP